jgi:hypothetical protein
MDDYLHEFRDNFIDYQFNLFYIKMFIYTLFLNESRKINYSNNWRTDLIQQVLYLKFYFNGIN